MLCWVFACPCVGLRFYPVSLLVVKELGCTVRWRHWLLGRCQALSTIRFNWNQAMCWRRGAGFHTLSSQPAVGSHLNMQHNVTMSQAFTPTRLWWHTVHLCSNLPVHLLVFELDLDCDCIKSLWWRSWLAPYTGAVYFLAAGRRWARDGIMEPIGVLEKMSRFWWPSS